jgi:hypothetical protein
MDNAEWDIQLDAHPGPPCASRFSDGAYVPLGPAPSEYRIWCTVMMTTPTRIEGGARHRDGCRPLLAGPHSARAHKTLVAFRSAPATRFDGCASRQATDERSEPEPLHAPAAVGLSTAGPRRACGPVGMARFMGAPRAECPAMDNPSGILPCARASAVPQSRKAAPEEIAASLGSHLTAALIEG